MLPARKFILLAQSWNCNNIVQKCSSWKVYLNIGRACVHFNSLLSRYINRYRSLFFSKNIYKLNYYQSLMIGAFGNRSSLFSKSPRVRLVTNYVEVFTTHILVFYKFPQCSPNRLASAYRLTSRKNCFVIKCHCNRDSKVSHGVFQSEWFGRIWTVFFFRLQEVLSVFYLVYFVLFEGPWKANTT